MPVNEIDLYVSMGCLKITLKLFHIQPTARNCRNLRFRPRWVKSTEIYVCIKDTGSSLMQVFWTKWFF